MDGAEFGRYVTWRNAAPVVLRRVATGAMHALSVGSRRKY
jgi:hypothetical protein